MGQCNLSFHFRDHDDIHIDHVAGINVRYQFPAHIHQSLCIGIIIRGQRLIRWNDHTCCFEEGDIFIIHPDEPHAIESVGPHDYIACNIKGIPENIRYNHKIQSEDCKKLFLQLHEAIRENHPDVAGCWSRLYSYLNEKQKTAHSAVIHSRIDQALKFIRNHYHEPISIADIAHSVYMSKFHFCHIFKSETGLAPHHYLLQYRLSRAHTSLQCKNSVFDAAIGSGFYDSSHFIRTFQSNMAVTPKEYQNSVLRK